ncbi:uncharacterized protein LOC108596493 [Drosophila busckii]|uniref:uncharacterized protein LOC108596493 n=1 Tax=Drosophila busckii TaxID=30019 RepID=UPI00083ECEFD|nr:uncharacterized protein LOC108596493 [Drosophila busckii]
MWSTLWLLLSSSLLAQVLAADYEMILEDSDVFEDCTDAPPGAVNIHGLMDLSDITMHLDGYKVRVEGTARTNWNIQPGDRIAGGITIMKFNRGLWEPTLLNIATQDFCKMMYNPNEYWYKYWTRFVTNAADVKDKCLSNPGTIMEHEPFDLEMRLYNMRGPILQGRYKLVATLEAFDKENHRRPESVCFEIRGDFEQINQ